MGDQRRGHSFLRGPLNGLHGAMRGQAPPTPQACAKPAPGASSPDKNIRGSAAMTGLSRRHFLNLTGSAAIAALSGRANAAMGPNDKFVNKKKKDERVVT